MASSSDPRGSGGGEMSGGVSVLVDTDGAVAGNSKAANTSTQVHTQTQTHAHAHAQAQAHTPKMLPETFAECEMTDLIILVSDMIRQLIHHNDRLPLTPSGLTRFHSRAPPGISVADYLSRIVRYTSLEKVCLLSTVIYIDRLCGAFPSFVVSSLTIHRFLITATTVATKGLCDAFCTNTHYAKVGGISLSELNVLELELLAKVNWRILCSNMELQTYYTNLCLNSPRYTLPDQPALVGNTEPQLQHQQAGTIAQSVQGQSSTSEDVEDEDDGMYDDGDEDNDLVVVGSADHRPTDHNPQYPTPPPPPPTITQPTSAKSPLKRPFDGTHTQHRNP
ncbi:Pho80p cyclin [Savitreella phatthalungensis]